MRYMTQHGNNVKHLTNPEVYYEVHVDEHPETFEKGHFDVFVGQEVATLEDMPIELSIRILPLTTYAMFTLYGQQIFADWMQAVWEWFQRSRYQRAYTYGFQLYDRRFKGLQNIEESAIDVYIPVKLCLRSVKS
jgi:AraC family transcriptional regulator